MHSWWSLQIRDCKEIGSFVSKFCFNLSLCSHNSYATEVKKSEERKQAGSFKEINLWLYKKLSFWNRLCFLLSFDILPLDPGYAKTMYQLGWDGYLPSLELVHPLREQVPMGRDVDLGFGPMVWVYDNFFKKEEDRPCKHPRIGQDYLRHIFCYHLRLLFFCKIFFLIFLERKNSKKVWIRF